MDKRGMRDALAEHHRVQKHRAEFKAVTETDPGVPERSRGLDSLTRFNKIAADVQLMPRREPSVTATDRVFNRSYYPNGILLVPDPPQGYSTLGVRWESDVMPTQGPLAPEQVSAQVIWLGVLAEGVAPELTARNFEYTEQCYQWMFRDDPEKPKPEHLVELNKLEHSLILFEKLVKADPTAAYKAGISENYMAAIAARP